MLKRATAFVYSNQDINDDYGGKEEFLVLDRRIHGQLEQVITTLENKEQGATFEIMQWFKTHIKITDPSSKVWKIDGVRYKVVLTQQNRRRMFYQLKQV